MQPTALPPSIAAPLSTGSSTRADRGIRLAALLRERILVLDGAMGTMLQAHDFDEAAYRGDRFRDHPWDLRGDNDLLSLTQPAAVRAVHAAYLDAGADIISTNTFTAMRIAQADYGLDPA
ncbi:MAG: homocysteine S-methyltransferase family protein, partial [Candidatus Limnocylindrales bacterium]